MRLATRLLHRRLVSSRGRSETYSGFRQRPSRFACERSYAEGLLQRSIPMGKYLLAWILGVPAVVLVAVYFFMH